uniref:Uncharacterized protein n=1 Tax=viral metagenome TaxID=1070528 RepID=A0A6C0ACE2_9ZZZZ
MFVQKKGYFYYENNDDLSIDYSKGWFIVSQLDKTEERENLEKIIKLANIRRNMALYDCSYEVSIEKDIKNLEEKSIIKGKDFIH